MRFLLNKAVVKKTTKKATKKAAQTDAYGVVFDPKIHATTKDGAPWVNADGGFRAAPGKAKQAAAARKKAGGKK